MLHPHCPVKVDALCKNRRRSEHGLTTVGLKIHCFGDNRELLNLIEALGGRSEVIANRIYAHARASVTVILPPVGSARSAILLLECIEKYFGHPIFHNPRYQTGAAAAPPPMCAGLFSYHFVHIYVRASTLWGRISAPVAASINTAMKGLCRNRRAAKEIL